MTTNYTETFIVPENTHQISCDGGIADDGHPKVYYTFDGQDEVVCGYCGRAFSKVPVAA